MKALALVLFAAAASAQTIVPLDTTQPTTLLYGSPEIRSVTVACVTATSQGTVRLEYKDRTVRSVPIPASMDVCGELAMVAQGAKIPLKVETPHKH